MGQLGWVKELVVPIIVAWGLLRGKMLGKEVGDWSRGSVCG